MSTPEDPGDLSPSTLAERYLDRRRIDAADETIRTYEKRLEHVCNWCRENDIEQIGELSGWHIDQFETSRRGDDVAPSTLKGELVALRQLLKYAARLDAVDQDLPNKVDIPNLSKADERDETALETADATALLSYFRESRREYGTPHHAALEVFWNTGCRLGGLRALDVGDFHREEMFLLFQHRPETGTPLKNNEDGERAVAISEEVRDALAYYVDRERPEKRDEQGREPLFCCYQGRPSRSTVRAWTYYATQPCWHSPCPHGEEPQQCEYRLRNQRSKCPSSRSPHQIRTGSITWQLNSGIPLEVVAERVNASPGIIALHYDVAREIEKMQKRRRDDVAKLDIGSPENQSGDERDP